MHEDSIIVALGGNLAGAFPSVQALLESALNQFSVVGLRVLKRSSWWRSASWPDPTQPDYLNGLALVETTQDPRRTLRSLREIEAMFGRERARPNASRTLDLDLIAHGRAVLDEPDLVVPHPRAAERLFVMGPLAEIAPGWTHPVSGETVSVLAERATIGRDARPI
jgi:2-amino-4-hydroxy-6-hydroxymethyldihydropteridine diphosphokinase